MKAVKGIKRVWDEIFDFFCGDYIVLIGCAVTICLVILANKALTFARPASGFILVIGIVASFTISVWREKRKAAGK
ncbi:MAG: hypothetical protein FWF44_04335 [Defluviitaleaceae bacterium]|nr:hypothetical protein [Defluviitaleaceae bacterium]